jgi:DNA-binding XRE family transcriptional regulator
MGEATMASRGINKVILNRLKFFRTKEGMTLESLARATRVSKGHIHSVEAGRSTPSIEVAYKIAKVLGMTVYEIWGDETEVEETTITIRRIVEQ